MKAVEIEAMTEFDAHRLLPNPLEEEGRGDGVTDPGPLEDGIGVTRKVIEALPPIDREARRSRPWSRG